MDMIENRTSDEIQPGDTASLVRTLSGVRVPIVLTSRADSPLAHITACALAQSTRKAKS